MTVLHMARDVGWEECYEYGANGLIVRGVSGGIATLSRTVVV